jgi:hypothetical protein
MGSLAKAFSVLASALLLTLAPPQNSVAQGDPKRDAEKSASAFLIGLQTSDIGKVYDTSVAKRAKSVMTREAFVQNVNVFRIQMGGPAQSRLLVGSTPIKQLQTGETGNFYYVRYREVFSAGHAFADVMLEHEGGSWLVFWYNYTQAPPQ